jgi:hypothetical protein
MCVCVCVCVFRRISVRQHGYSVARVQGIAAIDEDDLWVVLLQSKLRKPFFLQGVKQSEPTVAYD